MSSEYNGNILYVKDENEEWIPIPAIVGEKGADGEQGPVGPQGEKGEQGEPGTTEWSGLDNKPFESIGTGLSVDSEGNLNAEGGVSDWSEVENKPFETLGTGLSVDGEGVLSAQGQSYTFTNGLTENSGTVSWDLNDRIFQDINNGSIKLSDANNQATGVYSTAVGLGSTNVNGGIRATAAGAFAGGSTNTGEWGTPTTSSNNPSYVRATGVGSFAYGAVGGNNDVIEATGRGAVAIGFVPADGSANKKIQATGNGAFAHGTINVLASGTGSHAEGRNTTSAGAYSFAGGFGAYAGSDYQYVIGKYNKKDTSSKYAFIIGNGTSDTSSNRKNALTVDWDGNIVCNNIPAPPSTDGTYTLQCTVTNGVPTYSWV